MLIDRAENYRKSHYYRRAAVLVGNGQISAEGDLWQRQRTATLPEFVAERIRLLGPTITTATLAMLEGWAELAASGRPFDIGAEMMQLTLGIAARAFFDVDLTGLTAGFNDAMLVREVHVTRPILSIVDLEGRWPLPFNLRYRRAQRQVDSVVDAVLAASAAHGPQHGLLGRLRQVHAKALDSAATEAQLRDDVLTLLLAGYQTTALALTWCWYLLDRHPAEARRLQAELADVLAGRPPTTENLPRLGQTSRVIQETLRLYPPVWVISRTALADDQVGPHTIPAGANTLLSAFVTHRHPAFWPQPARFDPDRFRPERAAGRPRLAYFPFGAGLRQCIGSGLALIEMPLILATVLQRFRPVVVPARPVVPWPLLMLRVRDGLRVTLEKVRG